MRKWMGAVVAAMAACGLAEQAQAAPSYSFTGYMGAGEIFNSFDASVGGGLASVSYDNIFSASNCFTETRFCFSEDAFDGTTKTYGVGALKSDGSSFSRTITFFGLTGIERQGYTDDPNVYDPTYTLVRFDLSITATKYVDLQSGYADVSFSASSGDFFSSQNGNFGYASVSDNFFVPLPASAPLFGAGLLALGALSVGRRHLRASIV